MHDGNFGSGRFCSRACSNARVVSQQTRDKISHTIKKKLEQEGAWGYLPSNEEERRAIGKRIAEAANKKIIEADFDSLSYERKRKRIIMEQGKCCANCKLDKWMEHTLTLEIDHINGDNKDDRRENMVALCPNCHSITPTWRGRNKAKKREKLSGLEIYELYLELGSIGEVLSHMGMATKGNNYSRIKRVIKRYDGIYTK